MKTWLRLTLVLFMVGGGFAGLAVTLPVFLNHSAFQSPFQLLASSLFLVTFSLVTCGGLLFVYDPRHTILMRLTLATQMVQISCPIGVYKFLTGVGFYIFFSSGQIEPHWARISEHFDWWINVGVVWRVAGAQSRSWDINLNLIAVLLFVYLQRIARSQKHIAPEMAKQPTFWDTIPKPPRA